MKRNFFILVATLVICFSSFGFVLNDFDVRATDGGDDGTIGKNIGLDLDSMWNATWELANITHNYPLGLIPKGRDFGTWGDNYAADNILKTALIDMDLENVKK